jgi:hypothetical protein
MDDDGTLAGVGDPASDIGEVGDRDPTIRLEVGARCIVTNVDYFSEPLEIVAKGANAFDDVVLLAENSPFNPAASFASGNRSPGVFQHDPMVNFVDDPVAHTISFTVTAALANAMSDPTKGLTPGYRCGNPAHRNSQRGDFIIVSGDLPAKSQQELDDVGDTTDTAGTILLTPTGSGGVVGAIQAPGNQDMYRLVAPASGRMTINLSPTDGSALQDIVFVDESDGDQIGYHVAADAGQSIAIQLDVLAGQTYFVQVADFTNATGGYELTFNTSPTPSPFPGARFVPADTSGANVQGAILTPKQIDNYYFVAPVTGQMIIRQDADSGSALDSQLSVYDKTLHLLASDDNSDGGFDSRVEFSVAAGQPYLVQASGRVYVTDVGGSQVVDEALSTGAYQLLLIPQDFGSTFAAAQPLTLDVSGTSQKGTIATADAQDMFRFVAPTSGTWEIGLAAPSGSSLVGTISIFDGSQALLANETDETHTGDRIVRVDVQAAKGQTYYVRAAGASGSTGRYILYVVPDPGNHSAATASPLDLISDNLTQNVMTTFATQPGVISTPGESGWFRFTAPASGPLQIRQFAVDGSSLDSSLAVYDAANLLLADADDDGSSLNSQVVMNVTAGQSYFIRAAGVGDSTGRYRLTLSTDNSADTFTAATFLDTSSGSAVYTGYIGGLGDVDLFRFTAPASGPLPIELTATPRDEQDANLDGQLAVFDASGKPILQDKTVYDANEKSSVQHNAILQDDDSGGDYNSYLTINKAVQGATYYVSVKSFGSSSGAYRLVIGKEHGSIQHTASPLAMDASGSAQVSGRITQGDDWYHFTSTVSGPLVVALSIPNLSNLTGQVTLYNNGQPLASAKNVSGAPAAVTLNVMAGHDYYIQVQGLSPAPHAPQTTGPYALYLSVPATNSTPGGAVPLDLSTGTATAVGDIAFPSASGWFKFQAPVSGMIGIQQSNAVGSFLIDTVSVYSNPNSTAPLSTVTGFSQTFASLQMAVTAGQTYYINSSAFGSGTGQYDLSVVRLPSSGLQLQTTDLTAVTPQDLVISLLGQDSGITVVPGTVQYIGALGASGVFSGGAGIVGIPSGALLTTGSTSDVVGPNFTEGSPGYGHSTAGDPDLDQLVQGGTRNAAVVSFDFIPSVNLVQLSYVFASAEYSRFSSSVFDDVFGAFVNGVDYARVPGSGTPAPGTGDIVSVNTINQGTNAQFFIDNSIPPTGGLASLHTQMNGLTTVLTLEAPVHPGQVNHIKLAIADAVDPLYTSAVFLQQGSFHAADQTVDRPVGNQSLQTLARTASVASVRDLGAAGTSRLVNNAVVQELVASGLTASSKVHGDFLVLTVDPVDYTLTDFSGGGLSNPFHDSDGTNSLLIVPNVVSGLFHLDLVGVGGNFQIGASYVTAFGQVTSVLVTGTGSVNTDVVLDFSKLDGRIEVINVAAANRPASPGETISVPGASPLARTLLTSVVVPIFISVAQAPTYATETNEEKNPGGASVPAVAQSSSVMDVVDLLFQQARVTADEFGHGLQSMAGNVGEALDGAARSLGSSLEPFGFGLQEWWLSGFHDLIQDIGGRVLRAGAAAAQEIRRRIGPVHRPTANPVPHPPTGEHEGTAPLPLPEKGAAGEPNVRPLGVAKPLAAVPEPPNVADQRSPRAINLEDHGRAEFLIAAVFASSLYARPDVENALTCGGTDKGRRQRWVNR